MMSQAMKEIQLSPHGSCSLSCMMKVEDVTVDSRSALFPSTHAGRTGAERKSKSSYYKINERFSESSNSFKRSY